jgi:bifunctional DNA-binding transcriptional regulator/antitoxin component of YhaV-PrlF toxin-antitoxin module
MTYQAKMITGGKVVVPAEIRRQLGVKDGDPIYFEQDEHGRFVIKSYAQKVREAQAWFRAQVGPYEGSMVDDFIAEKRLEAEDEERRTREWLAKYHPSK